MCWLAISSWRLFSSISVKRCAFWIAKHRLGGEGFEQIDYVLWERAGGFAADDKCTHYLVASEQWNDQQCPVAGMRNDVTSRRRWTGR